jgi:3-hydroxyisobutyrate dehydrogenase-like beta-hydroxyacid dehydrogenase
MPTVAFLGLGAIGRPMAARLAAAPGVSLAVWNRTAERARAFAAETGARHAATPADAAPDGPGIRSNWAATFSLSLI